MENLINSPSMASSVPAVVAYPLPVPIVAIPLMSVSVSNIATVLISPFLIICTDLSSSVFSPNMILPSGVAAISKILPSRT